MATRSQTGTLSQKPNPRMKDFIVKRAKTPSRSNSTNDQDTQPLPSDAQPRDETPTDSPFQSSPNQDAQVSSSEFYSSGQDQFDDTFARQAALDLYHQLCKEENISESTISDPEQSLTESESDEEDPEAITHRIGNVTVEEDLPDGREDKP